MDQTALFPRLTELYIRNSGDWCVRVDVGEFGPEWVGERSESHLPASASRLPLPTLLSSSSARSSVDSFSS